MRAILWVGALAAAACGEVKTQQSKPDANVDPMEMPDAAIDAAIDAPPSGVAMITGVSTPNGGVEVESNGTVTATIAGPPSTQVTVAFAATLGTYSPTTRTITTDATGAGTASSSFIAGTTAGNEAGNAKVTSPNTGSPYSVAFPVTPFSRYGYITQLTTAGSFGANNLLGQTIATTATGHLKKIGIVSAAVVNVKVGIYTNNGSNLPGTLLAQTAATTLAVGANEIALTTQPNIAAGTYWMMAIYETQGSPYTDASTNRTICYISQTYASALPTTFPAAPTAMTYMGKNFNYYLVVGK